MKEKRGLLKMASLQGSTSETAWKLLFQFALAYTNPFSGCRDHQLTMVFKMHTLSLPRTKEDLLVIHDIPLKRFSFKELKLATDNFSNKNIVGRGGFGNVYKGLLTDGSLVAIKRCTDIAAARKEVEFQSEVEIGGSRASDHPNVLRLLGYCTTPKERILVYPFLTNRSVYSWLHDRLPSDRPLDWPTRKRIALGAAKGLAHFHHASSFAVIHRDVKSSNILLDDQFEAVICDFGLVRFIGRKENESNSNWVQRPMEAQYDDEDAFEEDDSDHDNNGFTKSCWNLTTTLHLKPEGGDDESRGHAKWSCWFFTISESGHTMVGPAPHTYLHSCTHVTTNLCGTVGYIDPNCFLNGYCSVKNDVFGYGVTLLELVSGQRPYGRDRDPKYDPHLHIWARQVFEEGKLDVLVDSNMTRRHYMKEEMKQLIQLALSCTKEDPEQRPTMSDVIKIIENFCKRPCANQLLTSENDLSVQRFTLPELKLATSNFSNKNIIGKSGISNVYKGHLREDGSTVVVKRLVKRRKRGMVQFKAEVKLGRIRHPNLLQLRGYCIDGKEMLLVYPFMAKGSLEWRLRQECSLSLDWRVRKKIALGVAKVITYLHYDCESNVSIGRNIRPYNILLDEDFNPVLCNLSLQSRGIIDHTDTDIDTAVSCVDDVYGYGITLFVLISGKVSTGLMNRDSFYNDSVLHDWFKKLRDEFKWLLDLRMHIGDEIKDEIEQLIQVALLCTQPSLEDRPEMWQVMQMLQGISEGHLKVCFPFDRANFFGLNDSFQSQLSHEFEPGDTMDLYKLDSEGSIITESDQIDEVQLILSPKKDVDISSKGKQVAVTKTWKRPEALQTKLRSQYKGITISDSVLKPKLHEEWNIFLSDVVSDVLPTKSKLCQSGASADPLCPMCNEYEEDSLHLFFNCDFSRQAWLLAVGVRIDMLGLLSVKEAVDVILKPNGSGLNILPQDVEPSTFVHKGVALMHSIWIHRNQVCSNNVSPNVMQMLKDHPDTTHLYSVQPPPTDTKQTALSQEIQLQLEEAPIPQMTANYQEIEQAQLQPEEVLSPEVLANYVMCESSQEIEPTKLQPERILIPQVLANSVTRESSKEIDLTQRQPEQVLLPKVIESEIDNNQKRYLQVNIITSGGLLFSFKFNKPSVLSVAFIVSICMNLLFVWLWAKPRY